jgi:hypothetical protein
MTTSYKVYQIDKYIGKTSDFIESGYKEYGLKELCKILEKDHGYHMRINVDKNYIFFGDCDKFDGSFEEFAELLTAFLAKHYKIKVSMDDISYTENEGICGSFHYSIPKIYGSCKKLKEMHEKFYKNHIDVFLRNNVDNKGKSVRVVDTSIYANKWFRYPKQKKETKEGVRHIIQHGMMADFVVEHIPKKSKCIDDKEYIEVKIKDDTRPLKRLTRVVKTVVKPDVKPDVKPVVKPVVKRLKRVVKRVVKDNISDPDTQSDDVMDEKIKITGSLFKKRKQDKPIDVKPDNDTNECDPEQETRLDVFKETMSPPYKKEVLRIILSGLDTYDDCCEWTNVGMALKNESCDNHEFFELWNEWSKQGDKYDGKTMCRKKWNSFTKMRGYSLEYLVSLLEARKSKKYEDITKIVKMQKIVKDNNNLYPKNKCNISKLNSTDTSHNIIFTDNHCPIYDDLHSDDMDKGHRFFEISNRGTAGMKCTHSNCIGKICPVEGIPINKGLTKVLFMNANIDNRVNITNNYTGKSSIFDVRSILTKDDKLFADEKLNDLVINCLYENSHEIVDTIIYVNLDKICFADSKWYWFDVIWTQSDNAPNKAISNFVTLYAIVKKFVMDSTKVYGVEKREYIDQITKFCDKIEKGKMHKHIVSKLAIGLTTKNKFDSNMNLLGFSNGVYDFEIMEFRKGKPSDMIRTSCGYDHYEEYENRQNIFDTLMLIFSDKKSVEFFLSYVAMAMCGKNTSLILMLKSIELRYCYFLSNMLSDTFGDYCNVINHLSQIISTKNKTPIDLSYLKPVRFVIVESANHISCNDVGNLVNFKRIKHQNTDKIIEKFDIHFSTLCMCDEDPVIDEDVVENIAIVTLKKKKYNDMNFDRNDFFLLLLEYVKKYNDNNFVLDKQQIEINKQTEEGKICHDFIRDCIQKSDGREKSSSVYDKYIEWSSTRGHSIKLTRQKLFSELKKTDDDISYKKAIKFNGSNQSSGFIGITLI